MLSRRLNHLGRSSAMRSCSTNKTTRKSAGTIRKEFIDYFTQSLKHKYVRSSPVRSLNDPTIPFVNAGMNQFKGVFLGQHDPPAPKVANSQKCIRVGGKHNDLDAVGLDTYHHTFFEMLGNWSFGDYSKAEACEYAWHLLTGPYGMNRDQLYFTYFAGDEKLGLEADTESRDIWRRLGVPESRVLGFGVQDNFWEMGLTGPCGPCTEIHIDHAMHSSNQASRVNKGYSDLTELWNIVFIQYQRLADGSVEPLEKLHVDTGMGFERLAAVLQGKRSNYDTDLFTPLFSAIEKSSGAPKYEGRFGEADKNNLDTGYRTLADHARMVTVALADGMTPDLNRKLRIVLRKALAVGESTFRHGGILQELTHHIAESLGDVYPEIRENLKKIQKIIQYEEHLRKSLGSSASDKWQKLLEVRPALGAVSDPTLPGLFDAYKDLQNNVANLRKIGSLPGDFAYKLYDSYGLSAETIAELAAVEGLSFSKRDFDRSFDEAKFKSKVASGLAKSDFLSSDSLDSLERDNVPKTDDSHKYLYSFGEDGYQFPPVKAKLLSFVVNGKLLANPLAVHEDHEILRATVAQSGNIVRVDAIVDTSNEIGIILNRTPCYAPEGGQLADKGQIRIGNVVFNIEQVQKVQGYVVHIGRFAGWDEGNAEEELQAGDECEISIDSRNRTALMRNHTSTHLVNAALRKILPLISQRSSLVSKDSLSFQFGVFGEKFDVEKVAKLEQLVNECIASDVPVSTKVVDMTGLLAERDITLVPGEVYPNTNIRIVEVESEALRSKEACCGTHVHRTGVLEQLCVLSVTSHGSGARTIKAVAGPLARLAKLAGENAKQEVAAIVQDFEKGNVQPSFILAKIDEMKRFLNNRSARKLVAYLDTRWCVDSLDNLLRASRAREQQNTKTTLESEMKSVVSASKMPFVVHCLQPIATSLDNVSLEAITSLCTDTPVLVIVHSESKVKARCCVPKPMISASFNALSWMQSIASIFEARYGSPPDQDPSHVCDMNTKKLHRKRLAALVETAITEATKFAELHVSKSKHER